ncbi:hypothetical protein FACS1894124_1570 [Spirochaetia bacterium]|nr:hypothetical protein FACS1894124_1570 [Spirochaetia bacterium]
MMKHSLRTIMAANHAVSRVVVCVVIFALGLAALTVNCAGFSTKTAGARAYRYTPGVYAGTGQGFRGPVQVAVRLDANGITGIEILKFEDDYLPGGAAMEELLELLLDGADTGVDAISGATESSAGFLSAVEDALGKAIPNLTTDLTDDTDKRKRQERTSL